MVNPANMLTRQVRSQVRSFMTSAIRRSGHHHDPYDGIPGYNFPFSTQNRHKMLLIFMCWFGSAFSVPFWMVRHQLLK